MTERKDDELKNVTGGSDWSIGVGDGNPPGGGPGGGDLTPAPGSGEGSGDGDSIPRDSGGTSDGKSSGIDG